VIGDFVTLAPGAKINGNVVVQDHAYIGTGAMIRQGRPGEPLVIGEGAIVGMGAVVTRSVPPGVTVVGNPARPL
jgi:acetyltransferase-like isoleucine patch superfamily enzyme